MRTTIDINTDLLKKAQKLTKIEGKTSLIHEALRALIAKAAQQELIQFSGTQKKIKKISRRKS